MSTSHIEIVRPTASATVSDVASSGSPTTGLYIPVHRRNASASSSGPAASPSPSPSRRHNRASSPSWHARTHVNIPSSPRATASIADYSIIMIPQASQIPSSNAENSHSVTRYTIPELLALAESTLVATALSPEVQAHITQIFPAGAVKPAAPSKPRHRRTGRRASNATRPKLPATVSNADIESRRRRHAGWGWSSAHHPASNSNVAGDVPSSAVSLDDSWRHARPIEASCA